MRLQRRLYLAFLLGAGLTVACGQSVEQRRSKIHELQADPSNDNLEQIRAMLDDTDRDVRAAALNALAQQGAEDALEMVLARLSDPDGFVRATAIALVGELGNAQHAGVVGQALAGDPDPLVRQRAAEALGALGGESAIEGLIRGLEDSVERVRLASVEGVRRLDPAPATPVLSRLLAEDDAWEVRAGAAQALGESETDEAEVPAALEAALADENEYVRAAAARALRARENTRARQPLGPETQAAPPAGS